MLRASLLFALFVVFACLSAVRGQTPTFACGGAGYSLAGIGDINVTYGGYLWTINPCVPISTGLCAGNDATFCQTSLNSTTGAPLNNSNTVVSYYNPAVNVVAWSSITNGIMSRSINGAANANNAGCGENVVRSGTVQYFCNATATTAVVSSVIEVHTCNYLATVQTSLVCAAPLAATATPVGLPFASTTCGGGLYNLAAIDSTDFYFNVSTTGYWFRPCSPITSAGYACTGVPGASFCQQGGSTSLGNGTSLSQGSGLPQTYTLQSNGLLIQSQDGTLCGGNGNTGYPREANVLLQCDPTATSLRLVSFTENSGNTGQPYNYYEYCHYSAVFNTSTVCSANRLTTAVVPALQPTFACGGAGYDLTSISSVDLVYNDGTYTWTLNPCRPLTIGPCAGKGASFCQGSTAVAYYNPQYVPVQWMNYTNGTTTGVTSYSIFGDAGCGAFGERTGTVNYVCTPSATVPKIVSVAEAPQCAYTATVQTNAVCGTPRTAVVTSTNTALVGLPFSSTTCGGGLFNLAALDSTDFVFSTGGAYGLYWWRPCSAVSFSNCTSLNATFCQQTYGGGEVSLATNRNAYTGAITINSYTLQSNGLVIQSQDGTLCGSIPRAATSYLVCNQSASTPQLISFTENSGTPGYFADSIPYCHYELIIGTSAVCGVAAAPVSSSSSSTGGSTGGVIVVGGSSVSSSSAAAVSSGSSSSSAVVAARSSSSSSSSAAVVVASSSSSSSSSAAAGSVTSSSSSSSAAAARSSSSSFVTSSSSSSTAAGAAFTTSSSSSSSSSGSSAANVFVTSSSSSSSVVTPPITNANGAATTSVSVVLMAALMALVAAML